jgi:hypothetical protein
MVRFDAVRAEWPGFSVNSSPAAKYAPLKNAVLELEYLPNLIRLLHCPSLDSPRKLQATYQKLQKTT